jgi:hypothetical protein
VQNKGVIYVVVILVIALLCACGLYIEAVGRAAAYSGRLRDTNAELDRAVEQLGIANQRSYSILESVGESVSGLRDSLTTGTGTITSRLREVSTRVAELENMVDYYRQLFSGGPDNEYNNQIGDNDEHNREDRTDP